MHFEKERRDPQTRGWLQSRFERGVVIWRYVGPLALAFVLMPIVGIGATGTALSDDAAFPRGIEQVDFGNGTVYFGGKPHRLRHGRLAAPDPEDPILKVSLERPVFGHVEGYPGEVAAILIHSFDPGATGFFSELNLFAMRDGKPELVADLPGGDRADGGLHTAKFGDGHLIVEVYAPPPSGGVCCPGFVDTIRYRIAGGKLVRDGKPARREAIQDKDY